MAMDQADVAALFKETYKGAPPYLFERWNAFASMVKTRADVQKVGPRSLRLPKVMSAGGKFGFFSLDGGDMGRGNAAHYEAATLTPLEVRLAVEYTRASEIYTANSAIAVENAAKGLMKSAMSEFMIQMDKHLNTSGDSILATIESGGGTTTLVLTSPFGARRLRDRNSYLVYDSGLTAPRDSGTTFEIQSIDFPNRTIEIDASVAGTINTDVIVAEGLSGADPQGFLGVYYHQSSAATGTWMGLDRADWPQIRTPEVVAGSAFTQSHARLAESLLLGSRGDDIFSSGTWRAYTHHAQRQAVEETMTQVINYDKGGKSDTFDTGFNIDAATICGFKPLYSPTANPTRIDFIDFDNWGRGETLPVGMYDVENTQLFPIYGTSGGLASAVIFYLVHVCQYFVDDPGRGAYISSLDIPDGYPN